VKLRIPFSGVGFSYEQDDIDVVTKAMKSLDTLTQGKHQVDFQNTFSKSYGNNYSFATSSAAAAIELAAILFDLEPGDEVIAPAHTYAASVYPFARHGVKIKWADILKDQFTIDPESVRSLINKNTKVIVAVHLYGLPANMPEIMQIAEKHKIFVLEDCAQSIGAEVDSKLVGTFGDISVYSFHSHKNISTLGEGGMISTNNKDWASYIPGLRHNGHKPFQRTDDMYWSPAMSNVDFDIDGVWPNNFCIGEIQCALGKHLLSKVEKINELRRTRFNQAYSFFESNPFVKLQEIPKNMKSAHHLLPIKIETSNYKTDADLVFSKLFKEYGIQCAKQYYPLNRYDLFQKSGHSQANVPITDDFYDNQVSLPFHHWISNEDFEFLLNSVDVVTREIGNM
jgi:perosamine synthetase